MNWDQIAGNWKQMEGTVKQKWGKITDSDLTMINGKREVLAGKLREQYGLAKEEAEKQIDEFIRNATAGPAKHR